MKKAASTLKGVVKVAAVDGTANQELMQKYQVQGFPTIKIFGSDKKSPQDYQGERTAAAMVSESMKAVSKLVKDRSSGGSAGSSKSSSSSQSNKQEKKSSGSSGSDVVQLTELNFKALVMESNDQWLVEFYAPW
jgi:protein disulfide-isomerase A6